MAGLRKIIRKLLSIFISQRYLYFFKETKRYYYLFKIIRKIRPKNIMEIGTWNGNRAEEMIEETKNFWASSEITYYGFDLFENMTGEMLEKESSKMPPCMEKVEEKLKKTGAKIRLFKGNTANILPQAINSLPKMDFIFIDGGHSIDTISNDWFYSKQLMRDDTVVIFDDYYFDRDDVGAKSVVEKIDSQKFDVKILPVQDKFKQVDNRTLFINFVEVKKKK